MTERFFKMLKRMLKKASGIETVNEELQKFLSIYCTKPNVNVSSRIALSVLMLAAKKICSVFETYRKKMDETKNTNGKIQLRRKSIFQEL